MLIDVTMLHAMTEVLLKKSNFLVFQKKNTTITDPTFLVNYLSFVWRNEIRASTAVPTHSNLGKHKTVFIELGAYKKEPFPLQIRSKGLIEDILVIKYMFYRLF